VARQTRRPEQDDPPSNTKHGFVKSLFGECGHVRELRRALRCRHGNRADRTFLHMRRHSKLAADRGMDAPGRHLYPHRRLALEMDGLDLGPVQLVQLRGNHMWIGTRGVRSESDAVLARELD